MHRPTRRLALTAVALAFAATAPDARADGFDDAIALKGQGRTQDAADAFEAFANAHPEDPRAASALVEAGLFYFKQGRSHQRLHRNTPAAIAALERARGLFQRGAAFPEAQSADRARYMAGSASLFLWDLEGADREYGRVVSELGPTASYYKKAMVRQGRVRLHRLDTDAGVGLLRRFQDEFQGDQSSTGKEADRLLGYAARFGEPAPELDVETWIHGEPTTLEALRGRVVALYFFTTWCPNCAKEKAFIKDLHARFAERGLELVAVTDRSRGQTPEAVASYVQENSIGYRVAVDAGKTFPSYRGRAIPNLILIDREGRARWHDHPAALSDWTVERLLAEPQTRG